ncbi:UDP-glycosyltransferase 76C4-like [Hibiscus syriacus]|uniref:UDP-glycosyltransferase 76C4-like n=1 Tax=Hibiscus syriacus TaxID=106335 RepID=A0A6A2Y506_HIBSY|nr:uncharacterized protein LOC120181955 [Hibiscus syriacus]KAE8665507.1 UDP-glycosyltransferase 76C4-like [Hibiscus syriacus]
MVSSSSSSPSRKTMKIKSTVLVDAVSWYCSVALLVLILIGSIRASSVSDDEEPVRGTRLVNRPCDEIYVVTEGETLHSISNKCGDPFIVERNPHIHDPDDVFPGLVIKIIPSASRKL